MKEPFFKLSPATICAAVLAGTSACGGGSEAVFAPTPPVPVEPVAEIAVAPHAMCARLEGGEVACIGTTLEQLLGEKAPVPSAWVYGPPGGPPVYVAKNATSVALAADGGCATHADGAMTCWGPLRLQQFGVMPPGDAEIARIEHVSNAEAVAVSRGYSYVLDRGGFVTCHGCDPKTPQPVALPGPAVEISGPCARLVDGRIACWKMGPVPAPELRGELVDLPRPAIRVRATSFGGCAVLDDGHLSCWGEKDYRARAAAVDARAHDSVTEVADVAVGGVVICVVHHAGTVSCWGDLHSIFPEGPAGRVYEGPRELRSIRGARAISGASETFCVLRDADAPPPPDDGYTRPSRVACFGWLGDGPRTSHGITGPRLPFLVELGVGGRP